MALSFGKSWNAFVELMQSNQPLRIPHQLLIHEKAFINDSTHGGTDTVPQELVDSDSDSPQNAVGMDEDNLIVDDVEAEESNIIRVTG